MVTVDGQPLPEHYEVKRFTKYGFEWTYEGESPQQLALAILYDHLGDKESRHRAVGAVHEEAWSPISTTTGRSRARTSTPF